MEPKFRVSYLYNEEIGDYRYGEKHFMDPKRISMAHSLIVGYGIYKEMDIYKSREASHEEIC